MVLQIPQFLRISQKSKSKWKKCHGEKILDESSEQSFIP